MVLIELNDDIAKFLCTECDEIIATGQNFLLSLNDLPKSRVVVSEDKIYYICTCGSKYELIKSSNPGAEDFLKFKHVRVVEQEYILHSSIN